MIVDERMRTYINSLDMGNTPFLEELEQYAIRERVPIIRREMQSFIKMFLAVNRPKRILEVGTAIGFSTLLMCEYGPEDLEIVTIENYEKRIPIAKENFRRAGREAQITLLEGDAGQILKELEDSFDMIFMDAAKGQYINWLPDVMRLMKNGGVLISDNVLQEGDIIDIDIPSYSINVRVSDEEFENRKKTYVKPEPKVKGGWLERYSRLVSSANTGAVLK